MWGLDSLEMRDCKLLVSCECFIVMLSTNANISCFASGVADFSIAQFRFLQRLLLVHGRYQYVRTAKFVLLTFWKEMFFYMMQALYQRHNGYTGTSLYEAWSLTVLNTL